MEAAAGLRSLVQRTDAEAMNSLLETCQQWTWDSRAGSSPWAGWPGRQRSRQLGERPRGQPLWWLARPPSTTSRPQGYHLPFPLQIPQKFRQQVFLGCLPHPPRLKEETWNESGLYLELFPPQLCSGCCIAGEETPSPQPLSWRAPAFSSQRAARKESRQGRTTARQPLSFSATIILLISGVGEERVVYCSGFWMVVGFLDSDIHPGANPGKESELVIIALIPEPNAQRLIFSPFPKHEKPPTHPLSIFIPTENHIQNERL